AKPNGKRSPAIRPPNPIPPTIRAQAVLAGGATRAPTSTATSTRESPAEYTSDAALTARVKTALISEPGVKSTQINVESARGVVSLSGFVDNDAMASKAVAVAQRVSGVREVKNDMRIKPAS